MKLLFLLALIAALAIPNGVNAGIIDSAIRGVLYDISNEYNLRRYTREFKGELLEYRRNGKTYRICYRGKDAFYC